MTRYAIVLALCCVAGRAVAAAELGIQETKFTIDGKPQFLLGISYYGALGASEEFARADLDDMQKCGFNWIRVWATWSAFDRDISAVDAGGRGRESYLAKLKWLIAECDRRGMIVDVTLTRGGRMNKENLADLESYSRAVRALATALKPYRNWYLDLANERNIKDARFVSFEELAALRKTVREIDPERLVTASQGGDISKDELAQYLNLAKVDFIAPHRPRNSKSPGRTAAQTQRYSALMKELGRTVPVHYQEPFRRGFNPKRFQPSAEDFLTDLEQATEGGAAGWCFHNGDERDVPDGKPRRSFDMREKRLFDQLDEVERAFLERLRRKSGR